jgi:ADP-ribose pyrophosphatase YjhB (NUDIX family)
MPPSLQPHITVAAIIEVDGRFLMVEELDSAGRLGLNQPAGHLERGETLTQACIREVREESAYDFTPEYLIGVYLWTSPQHNDTYLRFAFCGQLGKHYPEQALDDGIVRAVWMSYHDIQSQTELHRSPLVLKSIQDYLAGKSFPLDILEHYV